VKLARWWSEFQYGFGVGPYTAPYKWIATWPHCTLAEVGQGIGETCFCVHNKSFYWLISDVKNRGESQVSCVVVINFKYEFGSVLDKVPTKL
jgi:hypothetical protein